MSEIDDEGTEPMLIRPPKSVANWLRRCAAEETVRIGRSVTANKLAVGVLKDAWQHAENVEGTKK